MPLGHERGVYNAQAAGSLEEDFLSLFVTITDLWLSLCHLLFAVKEQPLDVVARVRPFVRIFVFSLTIPCSLPAMTRTSATWRAAT
jgi:hypothetical protein